MGQWFSVDLRTGKEIIQDRSFLFHQGEAWVKITNLDFDVAMGASDGAEVSELVGLFLLDEIILEDIRLKKEFLGIHRDIGLALVCMSVRVLKRNIGSELTKVFKKHNLDIEL